MPEPTLHAKITTAKQAWDQARLECTEPNPTDCHIHGMWHDRLNTLLDRIHAGSTG